MFAINLHFYVFHAVATCPFQFFTFRSTFSLPYLGLMNIVFKCEVQKRSVNLIYTVRSLQSAHEANI